MFPSRRGSRAAQLALLSLGAFVVGCSANPANGALKVEVVLEAGLVSRCVKVSATDGMITRESKAIAIAGKSSLVVGVKADGLVQPVTVQALGFSDDGCTTRAPGEESETKEGTFTNPPSTVTLTLRPVTNGDGGFDGGGGDDGGADAGMDGGMDAGVDNDNDTYPDGVDCNDNNPNINPGATELCANNIDDDCNMQIDCAQTSCNLMACAGSGTCMGDAGCIAPTESVCSDNLDNDGDTLVDCADPDCPALTNCVDGNACTLGDRCVADGGCEGTNYVCPMSTVACFSMVGMCVPDGGGPSCVYTPSPNGSSCSDGLGCTQGESCTTGTCGGGTATVCNSPPVGGCFIPTGACVEPAGTCAYSPRPAGTGTCSDSNNCTINDTCAGDGGCAGTPVTCTPNQCQARNGCDVGGACQFSALTNSPCDAGTGPGTCNSAASCVANPTTLFPTPPSNFLESQLPDAGTSFNVTCATTLATSGPPAITNGACVTMPSNVIITQTMGPEPALLIRVSSLSVAMGQTLTIEGTRPVIFAVTGNVQIDGTIRLNNPGSPLVCGDGDPGTSKCGAGGGGFGTSGAPGGDSDVGTLGGGGGMNGSPALTPLRGGCKGGSGAGAGGVGGLGGGSIQIVASGTISISNTAVITAPGLGGTQPTGNDVGGGGGGSGGAILLEAPTITMTGTPKLTANGGSGSSGANGNTDGAAGSPANTTSATPVTGGVATDTGSGGSGGAGTTNPTAGGNDPDDGAGGGGGAVGRIRINATTCTRASAVISPPHTGVTCN